MTRKNPTKGIITKEQQTRKEFVYNKDGVQLAFSLRIDIKKELKAFIDLMEAAKVDLAKELGLIDGE
jgi:hypothetical protein